MAPMKASGTKNSSPHTMLVMAFPLVFADPAAATTGVPEGLAATFAETGLPHIRQNLSSAVMLFPQEEQNDAMHPPGTRRVSAAARPILHEPYYPRCASSIR